MCIANNVSLNEEDNEDFDNLGVIEDQETVDDYNVNNRNIDLNLGRQQREKIVRYIFHRNGV